MQSSAASPLLDLVYEAAAMPDLWPAVLDRMAGIAGGAGTFLITADPRTISTDTKAQSSCAWMARNAACAQSDIAAAASDGSQDFLRRGRRIQLRHATANRG